MKFNVESNVYELNIKVNTFINVEINWCFYFIISIDRAAKFDSTGDK